MAALLTTRHPVTPETPVKRSKADAIKARSAAYRAANREALRLKSAKWYAANKERAASMMKDYRTRNTDLIRRLSSEYAAKNKESLKGKNKAWYERNREYAIQKTAAWQKANPDQHRVNYALMAAKRRAAIGKFTTQDIYSLRESQNDRCNGCNASLVMVGYQIDHVIPISKGGSNWPDNLQLLCPRCNRKKAAKMPHEWQDVITAAQGGEPEESTGSTPVTSTPPGGSPPSLVRVKELFG